MNEPLENKNSNKKVCQCMFKKHYIIDGYMIKEYPYLWCVYKECKPVNKRKYAMQSNIFSIHSEIGYTASK